MRELGTQTIGDHALCPLLMLYASAYLDKQQAERRLPHEMIKDYGEHYDSTGHPNASALSDMPPEYSALYEAYHAYLRSKATRYRIKLYCREQMVILINQRGLSIRDIAHVSGLNISCISRFLNGLDHAISDDRLVRIIRVLGGVGMRDNIQVKDYSEKKLEDGMIEITFTLVMPDDVAAALDALCTEHDITLEGFFHIFLYWTAANPEAAREWLGKMMEEKS